MSKPEEIYDRYRLNRPIDIVNILYLLFIVSVYSIYMHNMYFDITGTRGKVFTFGSLLYVILFIVSYFLEIMLIKYYGTDKPVFYKDSRVIAMPEIWMGLFLIANIIALFMAPDLSEAWTGEGGRYFGLSLVMIIAFSFICLSREASVNMIVYTVFFLVSGLAYVMAVLQHFGFDPFGLRDKIVDRQKEMFISLFGNINTYGSYICVALPVFVALFIFGKKILPRVMAGIILFLAGMAIIPAKSDNVYLGLGVAFIVLFYIAILNKRFTEYIFSVLLLILGLETMAILNSVFNGSQKHINGIAKIIENPKIMLIFVLIIVAVLIISLIFRAADYEAYKNIQSWKLLIVFSVILIVAAAATIVLGVRSGNELFKFNDEWGTYRGYIWRRGVSLFKESSPAHKIFGNGNETIGYLMKKYYYAEMVEITNKKYDNLHNEILQYLVTTGLFGLIAYLGFVVTSFIYIGKRMKGDAVAIGCLAGAASYFAQSLVTLNQPITTPYFFVILAVGIGYIRYRDQGYGPFKDRKDENIL
ncbi:MAG: O-antigen ligase family protein [Eubacterium sp.]|nr:O-antigen ligase family protein [Eubacterium sp.]